MYVQKILLGALVASFAMAGLIVVWSWLRVNETLEQAKVTTIEYGQ